MVVLNNNSTDSPNSSGSCTSPLQKSLILEKLRKAHAQIVSKNQPHSTSEDIKSKQKLNQKFSKLRHHNSISSTSPEDKSLLLKRTAIQELLLSKTCQKLNGSSEKSLTSDISDSNLKCFDKRQDESDINDSYANDDSSCEQASFTGILHFKKPIPSRVGENIYYEDRGRMEYVDWTLLNKKKYNYDESLNEDENSNMELCSKIEKASKTKCEGNAEFLNFVEHSTDHRTMYEVQGNIKQELNTNDSPLLKIQRILNKHSRTTLSVTQEIKECFEPSQPKHYLVNVLDKLTSKKQNEKPKSPGNKSENEIEPVKECPNLILHEFNDNFSILMKKEKQESQIFEDIDDEKFNFEKPLKASSNYNSSLDLPTSQNNSINTAASACDSYFHKLKISCKESPPAKETNVSLDSDDMSYEQSSDFSELSISRRSTESKYEALQQKLKKLKNSSKQNLSRINHNSSSENIGFEEINLNKNEHQNHISLMKERCSRYFNNSNSITSTNNVDIVNVKMKHAVKTQNLLTAISTRYFPKTSVQENKCDEENLNKDLEKKELIESSSILVNSKQEEMPTDESESLDSDDNHIIFYKHTDSSPNQEVISDCETKINDENKSQTEIQPFILTEENNVNAFEEIDSDEEFDIVNLEGFGPFTSLLNSLKSVQQAIASEDMKNIDTKDDRCDTSDIDSSYKKNSKNSRNTKSNESSFEISENNSSSISASASSNADSNDSELRCKSANLQKVNFDNIFQKIKIDSDHLHSTLLNNYDNKIKPRNSPKKTLEAEKKKNIVSNRMKKMKGAVMKYTENLK